MSEILTGIRTAVMEGNAGEVGTQVQAALDEGITPKTILDDALIDGMTEVGQLFENGEYFVPEMLVSARAMKTGLEILRPLLIEDAVEPVGRVVIGTVRGDMHDIGKNMVATMLRGVGFEVVDLGINITVEDFVDNIERHRPDILGMSALLTTTMPEMKKVIDMLAARGLRDRVKVIVGGAPLNEKFARDIGADGYGADAGSSVDLARRLLKG